MARLMVILHYIYSKVLNSMQKYTHCIVITWYFSYLKSQIPSVFWSKINTGRMVIIKQSAMFLTLLLAVNSARKTRNVKTLAMAIQPIVLPANVLWSEGARHNTHKKEMNSFLLLGIFPDALVRNVSISCYLYVTFLSQYIKICHF